MTKRQPETTLNTKQRRLLKYYQGYSNLIAVSGGDTMLEPRLLIEGWSHRWDQDDKLATYIAKNFASAGTSWSPTTWRKVLLPRARAEQEAQLKPLLAKLPTRQRGWVERLLEYNWVPDERKLGEKLKRWTQGILTAAQRGSLCRCLWNLMDLFILSAVDDLRVYRLDRPVRLG
jgi:hypothetical protein